MKIFAAQGLRLMLVVGAALVGLSFNSVAQAQNRCAQLTSQLRTLERNSDFQNGGNDRALRSAQQAVRQAESRYVRGGCNEEARAGRGLSRQCRSLADDVLSTREAVEDLSRSVGTRNSVAAQREAILQEIARFGCSARGQQQQRRPTLLERLFGGGMNEMFNDGNEVIEPEYNWQTGPTVRSVCVRLADGYYWPISFATYREYLGNDATQCQSQCPATPVELFYYDNPGQEVEQMVSLSGQLYTSLPNAFKYRQAFDTTISCDLPNSQGTITTADAGGELTRAVFAFGEAQIPLPQRDPRGRLAGPITVAELAPSIPLPRRRPPAPGEAPAVPVPTANPAAPANRVVQMGDKMVRIVGPETPYAQLAVATP